MHNQKLDSWPGGWTRARCRRLRALSRVSSGLRRWLDSRAIGASPDEEATVAGGSLDEKARGDGRRWRKESLRVKEIRTLLVRPSSKLKLRPQLRRTRACFMASRAGWLGFRTLTVLVPSFCSRISTCICEVDPSTRFFEFSSTFKRSGGVRRQCAVDQAPTGTNKDQHWDQFC